MLYSENAKIIILSLRMARYPEFGTSLKNWSSLFSRWKLLGSAITRAFKGIPQNRGWCVQEHTCNNFHILKTTESRAKI